MGRMDDYRSSVSKNIDKRKKLNDYRHDLDSQRGIVDDLESMKAFVDDGVAEAIFHFSTAYSNELAKNNAEIQAANEERKEIGSAIQKEKADVAQSRTVLEKIKSTGFGAAEAERQGRRLKSREDELTGLQRELDTPLAQEGFGGELSENQAFTLGVMVKMERDKDDVFNRHTVLAGSMDRPMNKPNETTSDGTPRGKWKGDVFFLDDDFVPQNHNPDKKNIGEIRKELKEKYGLELDGIPYKSGVADFSSLSVAHVSAEQIAMTAEKIGASQFQSLSSMEKAELYQKTFSDATDGRSKRSRNFHIADEIAAAQGTSIPGLKPGYSAEDLRKWRSKNGFSWDEQLGVGYNLVPAPIHGSLSHTGLVGTSRSAYTTAKKVLQETKEHPEKYSLDEDSAPISQKEFFDKFSGTF